MNLKAQTEILQELVMRDTQNPTEEAQRIKEWKAQTLVVQALEAEALALQTIENAKLKPECFQFGTSTLTAYTDEKGIPWFNANEVCAALEYANPWDALAQHVDKVDDLAKREVIDSMGRNQVANFINESGLYALIFGSTKEEAKKFKKWVTSEVLPAIRKKGFYESPAYMQMKAEAAKAKRLTNEIHEVKDRNQYLEGKKAPWIDDHLLNNMKAALEGEVQAHRETAAKLYNGGWPSDESKGMARSRVKFVKHVGTSVLRTIKDLEGVFKGTEWEGALNISVHLNRIKGDLEFVKHW